MLPNDLHEEVEGAQEDQRLEVLLCRAKVQGGDSNEALKDNARGILLWKVGKHSRSTSSSYSTSHSMSLWHRRLVPSMHGVLHVLTCGKASSGQEVVAK